MTSEKGLKQQWNDNVDGMGREQKKFGKLHAKHIFGTNETESD